MTNITAVLIVGILILISLPMIAFVLIKNLMRYYMKLKYEFQIKRDDVKK